MKTNRSLNFSLASKAPGLKTTGAKDKETVNNSFERTTAFNAIASGKREDIALIQKAIIHSRETAISTKETMNVEEEIAGSSRSHTHQLQRNRQQQPEKYATTTEAIRTSITEANTSIEDIRIVHRGNTNQSPGGRDQHLVRGQQLCRKHPSTVRKWATTFLKPIVNLIQPALFSKIYDSYITSFTPLRLNLYCVLCLGACTERSRSAVNPVSSPSRPCVFAVKPCVNLATLALLVW